MSTVVIEMHNTNHNNKNVTQINIRDSTQNEIECCICLEQCQIQEDIKMKCCNQNIHKSCLLDWIISKKSNENCPLCRNDILDIVEIYTIEDFLNKITKKKCKNKNIEEILNKWYQIDDLCIYIPKDTDTNTDTNTESADSINYQISNTIIHVRQYVQNCLCIMITVCIVIVILFGTLHNKN